MRCGSTDKIVVPAGSHRFGRYGERGRSGGGRCQNLAEGNTQASLRLRLRHQGRSVVGKGGSDG